jgi:Sortase domain
MAGAVRVVPAVVLAAVLAAVLAGGLTGSTPSGASGTAARAGSGSSSASGQPATPPAISSFRSTRGYSGIPVPVRLRVPAAHVNTALQQLGRNADGTIAVPTDPAVAGWYAQGPRPGQPGPAVILGHVDSSTGPAVFYSVSRLKPGDAIAVDSADGSTRTFQVTGVTRVPKNEFPTDLVYLPTLQPALRLVTCGGSFDPAVHSYRDNVIVFAELA